MLDIQSFVNIPIYTKAFCRFIFSIFIVQMLFYVSLHSNNLKNLVYYTTVYKSCTIFYCLTEADVERSCWLNGTSGERLPISFICSFSRQPYQHCWNKELCRQHAKMKSKKACKSKFLRLYDFYGSGDPTNSVKHWRTIVGQSTR